jgi:hypothetical protein
MVATAWTDEQTASALRFWSDYQKGHDTTPLLGKTAGIDPASGGGWFGESAAEIVAQLESQGLAMPLYFVRVGFDHYLRKGAHR